MVFGYRFVESHGMQTEVARREASSWNAPPERRQVR
jgi:hypothetical protein